MFIANGLAADLGGLRDSFLLVLLLIAVRAAAKLLAVLLLATLQRHGLRQAIALGIALTAHVQRRASADTGYGNGFPWFRFRAGAGADELHRHT